MVSIKTNKILAQIGLIMFFIIGLIPFLSFVVDDAFISFVYSKNLISGNGLTYNGILVEGFSNPLWTLIFAPIIGLGADPLLAARFISSVSGIISILLVFELSISLSPDRNLLTPFLACTSVALTAPYLAWTTGGLETIFLSALITILVFLEWNDHPKKKYLSPVILYAISFTRPEGVIVFITWLIYRSFILKTSTRDLLIEIGLFIIPFIATLVIRFYTYGYLLPNTAYVKIQPSLSLSLKAINWLMSFLMLRPVFSLLLFIGILSLIINKPFNDKPTLAFGICLSFIAFVIFSGPDWMPHHRFIAPIIPLLSIPITSSLIAPKKYIFRTSLLFLAIISISFEIFMIFSFYKPLSDEFGQFTYGLIQGGKWIEENTNEDDIIAVVDAGALAYFSGRTTIDIIGLNDEHIAHSPSTSNTDYVFSYNPSLIQLHVGFNDSGEISPPTDTGHNLMFIENAYFDSCYIPDLNRPPDPFYPFLFFRKCQ